MPRNTSRGGRNNNPSGRNQYSDWGVMEMARERPVAAAAAAASAAAAGLFLWSRRSQISQQLSDLTDQFGEWKDNLGSAHNAPQMDDTAGLTAGRTNLRPGAGSRAASGTRSTNAARGRSTAPSRSGLGRASDKS